VFVRKKNQRASSVTIAIGYWTDAQITFSTFCKKELSP
jgi:hypothetical protein